MGFDVMVLLMCALLWAVHVVRLVRAPFRRAWPAFVIVGVGIGLSGGAFLLMRPAAPHVAVGAVATLLVVPALSVRAASKALRFGRIGRARALAWLAAFLRPLPIQRRFRTAVEISWRLSRGEVVDIERAIATLGATELVERAAHRVAFLSWTNDFTAMAEGLSEPAVMRFALRASMAAIVTTVTGETGTLVDLVRLHERLVKGKSLGRRTLDASGTLLAMAAYLGDVNTVRAFARELRSDFPPERLAFLRATAEQRAGDVEAARETVLQALRLPRLSVSGRQRLLYRLENPMASLADHERPYVADMLDDVRRRLGARRVLASLGVGMSRPAPMSWVATAVLCAVFIWQGTQSRRVVFSAWGLIAPYASDPDPYRLLTYAMLHVDVGHLMVNLLGLLIFGRFVEQHFGKLGWSAIYFVGALAGAFAFLGFSTRLGVAIGASGAVMALFGATVGRIALDRRLRSTTQGKRELSFLAVIAAGQLVGDLLIAQSSGSAHAGGFLAGFVLGGLLTLRSGRGPMVRGEGR